MTSRYQHLHIDTDPDALEPSKSIAAGTYSTCHTSADRPGWAVKKHQTIRDTEDLIHVLNEISAHHLASKHDVAPPLGRIWVHDSRVCCEMPQGTPLNRLMHKLSPHRRPEFLLHTFSECCRHLRTLHARRITHGDLYVDNVLIMSDNSVRLIDFGLASHWTTSMPLPVNVHSQKQPARCHLVSKGCKKGNHYAGDFFALLCLPVVFLARSHRPWGDLGNGCVEARHWRSVAPRVAESNPGNPAVLDLLDVCKSIACDVILPVQFSHYRSRWLIQTLIPDRFRDAVRIPEVRGEYLPTPEWGTIKADRAQCFRQRITLMEGLFNALGKKPRLTNVRLHPACMVSLPWRFLLWLDRVLYARILQSYPFPRCTESIVQALALICSLMSHDLKREHYDALNLVTQKGDAPSLIVDVSLALLANQDASY